MGFPPFRLLTFRQETFRHRHFITGTFRQRHVSALQTYRHINNSSPWTFRHKDFSTQRHFGTRNFRHHRHFGTGYFFTWTFWHMDIWAPCIAIWTFRQIFRHLCYWSEMSMCRNVLMSKHWWCQKILVPKSPCAEKSLYWNVHGDEMSMCWNTYRDETCICRNISGRNVTCRISGKPKFVSLPWKLDNLYCHNTHIGHKR